MQGPRLLPARTMPIRSKHHQILGPDPAWGSRTFSDLDPSPGLHPAALRQLPSGRAAGFRADQGRLARNMEDSNPTGSSPHASPTSHTRTMLPFVAIPLLCRVCEATGRGRQATGGLARNPAPLRTASLRSAAPRSAPGTTWRPPQRPDFCGCLQDASGRFRAARRAGQRERESRCQGCRPRLKADSDAFVWYWEFRDRATPLRTVVAMRPILPGSVARAEA
jgi:hypothetical protein